MFSLKNTEYSWSGEKGLSEERRVKTPLHMLFMENGCAEILVYCCKFACLLT